MPDEPTQEQSAEEPVNEISPEQEVAPEEAVAPEEQAVTSESELDDLANEVFATKEDAKPEPVQVLDTDEPAEEPPEEPEAAADRQPDRVRLTSLPDTDKAIVNTAVQMVRDGLATNIHDAISKIAGGPSQQADDAEVEEAEEEEEAPDTHQEAIDAKLDQITTIRAELTQAHEDFDNVKVMELSEALGDAKSDIKMLEYERKIESQDAERNQAQEAEDAFSVEYNEYRDQANAIYPDGAVEGTPLYNQIVAEVENYKSTNPGFFNSPDYPMAIAGKAAAKLGISPQFSKPDAAPAAQQQAQSPNRPRVAARSDNPLVGGNATTGSGSAETSARQVEAITDIDKLDALAEAAL